MNAVKTHVSMPMGRSMEDAERTIRQLRVDARAMQEDAELAVAELARATRTLRDALLDLARAGSPIRLEVADAMLAGAVVHVGDDVVRLVRPDRGVVDVAISALAGVQAEAATSGHATVSVGYPASLLARCRELLQVNAHVEIGRRTRPPVLGALQAATPTHVELSAVGDVTWLVPLAEVAWVRRVDR